MLLPYILAFCISYAVILVSHGALHWETLSDFVSKFTMLLEEVTKTLDLAEYPLDMASKLCQKIAKTAEHPSLLDRQRAVTYPPDSRKLRSLFPSDTIYRRHPPMPDVYHVCSSRSNTLAHRRLLVPSDYRNQSQLTSSHTQSAWANHPPSTSRYVATSS